VPVARDLSDLVEKVDWCLANDEAAREIAEQGQAFALAHTLEAGRRIAIDNVRRAASAPAKPSHPLGFLSRWMRSRA